MFKKEVKLFDISKIGNNLPKKNFLIQKVLEYEKKYDFSPIRLERLLYVLLSSCGTLQTGVEHLPGIG